MSLDSGADENNRGFETKQRLVHPTIAGNRGASARVDGGAGYARYQLTPKVAIGARAEYLSDRSGLFSGTMQALKEATFTTDYKVADGLLLRWEWRRDFSNHPYFYTETLGLLKRDQTTAGLGVVWWFGAKSGIW